MRTKKRLFIRMALWTGVVLALTLVVAGVAHLLLLAGARRFEERQMREREATVERSRQYLGELATSIDRLPVDPTLVGEIESRYFEERPTGPMFVWAMGTGGEFLFGVPRESFSRLNAIYDREVKPRLEKGVFLDRQSFLLGQLDANDPAALLRDLSEGGEEAAELWSLPHGGGGRSEGSFVLSAPFKTGDGAALGSLYLKRLPPEEHDHYEPDERLQAAEGVGLGGAALAFVFLWVLLPTLVYVDARERGVRRAPLFALLTVMSSLIGLLVYLIARPEDDRVLVCPGCGRELNGGAFCPHCGRDLSASFCATCRYPLKPDWAFCPACRTEIKPPVAGASPAG